ncbi:MAG: hypothetical protein D6812_16665 [Deltaproteobacteria bacterium]|nr:MAG: hypothetical protein D6812_16665 [Deltaproteobacteria bacterium]
MFYPPLLSIPVGIETYPRHELRAEICRRLPLGKGKRFTAVQIHDASIYLPAAERTLLPAAERTL